MRSTIRNAAIAAALGATVALLLAAVLLPVGAQNAPSSVAIDNFTFTPQRLTVKAGATVTWTNNDDIPHAIAAVNKLFRSKALDTDDGYSFTFATPGTYDYFCSLHPRMTGTIVVEAQTGSNAAQ
jgi:plastocyanin